MADFDQPLRILSVLNGRYPCCGVLSHLAGNGRPTQACERKVWLQSGYTKSLRSGCLSDDTFRSDNCQSNFVLIVYRGYRHQTSELPASRVAAGVGRRGRIWKCKSYAEELSVCPEQACRVRGRSLVAVRLLGWSAGSCTAHRGQ